MAPKKRPLRPKPNGQQQKPVPSEDARPNTSKTAASSSSVSESEGNTGLPTKDKGKGKALLATVDRRGRGDPQFYDKDHPFQTSSSRPMSAKLNNTQRRAARRQAAYDPDKAHEQRVESGLKHSPIVAEYLVEAFRHAAEVEDALQNVPNVEGDLASSNPWSPNSARVWAQIPPQGCSVPCFTLRAPPTSLNLAPFIADGTLVLSSCDDAPPASAYHYYIRVVETAERTKAALMSYLLAYPANAANTVLQLLLQGEDITSVHTQFRQSMELHGLESAVDVFIDSIRSNAHVSRLAATRLQTPTTGLPYVGITDTVPCAKRAADDIAQGAPERILRALLGCSTLNSAPGGATPIFEPTAEMIAIQDRLTASLPPFNFPLSEERDEALERRITTLIDDEVQLLGPCHPTKMAPAAIQSVKTQVAIGPSAEARSSGPPQHGEGHYAGGDVGKAGYWDAAVGPGPQEDRHLRRLLDNAIPPSGNLSEDIIARWIGPFIDFWRCTLSHLLYLLHVLLLAHLLSDLRPLLIFAQSNPVSAALRSGDLVVIGNSLPDGLRRQFFEDATPPASKAWLLEVKADAESILQSAGVTAALEVAKSQARRAELAVTFLRTIMSLSRGGSKNDYKRRAGLEAAAGTEARTVQLNSILAHAQLLDSLDLPPDPDYLAPFEHPILSDTFPAWFLGLKDGTEIVQSANAHGRSAEALKAVKERHAQFTAQNGMIEVMRKLMRPQSLYTATAVIGLGWASIIFSFHDCRSRGMLTITESNFPDLERVLYVHEILHDRCSLILGDLAPVLAQLQLIAVPVREILLLHKEELKSALCDMDVAAILSALQSDLEADLDVYVTEDDRNNIGLLVTLAVDVVLRQRSRCPVLFVPMDPEYRQGWSEVTADQLQHWFRACGRDVPWRARVEPSNAGQIEPSNATHSIKGGRACNNCFMDGKNEKNCVGRRFLETETILDLPPHFSRAIWYQYRLGVEWPAPRSSKKRKAKRNFATAFKRSIYFVPFITLYCANSKIHFV
ncbi:hypothetical protein B0H14DRAFT_2628277 [Mycena olivaceomarginata]|nr:hypothetical protein B0H14DRAFT_2628277 [Mycena olivaceomarginata]